MRLIDADNLQENLKMWDWQDLYLPVHFCGLIDDQPTVNPLQEVLREVKKHRNGSQWLNVEAGYMYNSGIDRAIEIIEEVMKKYETN